MMWRNFWTIVHYGSGLTIGAYSVRYLITGVKSSNDDKVKPTITRPPFMK